MGLDQDAIAKLIARTKLAGDCWEWTGCSVKGYGQVRVNGQRFLVHRLMYELHNGPIPDGTELCHACDNKLCCNPAHLEAGSHARNMADAATRKLIPKRQGEAAPNARLSLEDILDIRERRINGETVSSISSEYGVHSSHIYRICKKEAWKSV